MSGEELNFGHNEDQNLASETLTQMPDFESHIQSIANEKESHLDEKTARAIEMGYFDDVPQEKLIEEIGSIMQWENDHLNCRTGRFSDSTYYGKATTPEETAAINLKIEDAKNRYFSETSSGNREIMSTILKKMRFSEDLGDHLGIKDSWCFSRKPSFMEKDYCKKRFYYAGKDGLPKELENYTFNLSDDELDLLANAEDEDVLANSIKTALPDTIQEKILEKMSKEKYKKVVLENLEGAIENGDYLIDTEWNERIIKEVSDKKERAEAIYEIIKELSDKEAIRKVVDLGGINIYSIPRRREFVGIQRYGGKGFEL